MNNEEGLITMSVFFKSLVFGVFSAALMSIAACSNVASVLNLDSDLELKITAKDDINPDESEMASPLVVRLYELKDKKKFEGLEFYDIYQNDKKLLGKNMIEKHVLKHFVPDTKRKQQIVLNKKTTYIALFAEFSQYKDSDFRAVIKIDPHFDKKVDVILTGTSLQVDHSKREPLFELDEEQQQLDKDVKEAKSATESLSGFK